MSIPLLATKLFVPLLPHHSVSRPLLAKRLDDGVRRKLTLVCASAGFGKSTLIGQWAQDCPYPSAWLSLDEQDRDPNRFLEYLVASLQTISQSVGTGVDALLRGSPPPTTETVLTSLLNQLANLPGKLVLVLDDYHLAASTAVNEALTFLIDHMPAQLHLVIASREEPEISLGRLRVQEQLTEIRQQDLRFALAEAEEFFSQGMDVCLSQQQVHALEARTEGWIAGLKLAAISLQRHKNPESFIASFTGSHRIVQDYLIEEVLHQQDPDTQSFLLRTSVLDRLCGPLCDAVLQRQDGQQMLDQLDDANLFIVPLDTERRWYRYHHLFADLLRERLSQEQPAEPLHLRASQWYELNGMEVEAFHQAIAAKDLAAAIRLIEGNGMPLYFRGVTAPVVEWLSCQSHTVLNTYPCLWIAYCWSLLFAGQPRQLEEKLSGAEAAVLNAPHDMAMTQATGQIAVLRAWLAVYSNATDSIYTHASRALELLNTDSRPARTAAHCALGVAQMFRGERAAASVAFSKVIGAGRSSGNLMFTAVASIALAGIHATDYQLHLAAAIYREVIQMIADPTHLLGFEAHLGLARILYDWNQLEEAESHVRLCCQLAVRAESESGLGADILCARLMLIRNEHSDAEVLLTRTHVLATSRQFTDQMQEAADLQVLHMLRRGEVKAAAALANKCQLAIGQARTLLAQHKALAALPIVEAHRHKMQTQGYAQQALRAGLVQAMILHALGDMGRALQVMREAVVHAEQQGSIRLFVDEGEPIKILLVKLQHEAGIAQYVAKLLAAFGTPAIGESQISMVKASTSLSVSQEAFSQRELEILRLIQEGHSNQKISENLFVSLSTVKWHNQNIFAKLEVQRRTEAVARALELQLL